MEGLIYLAGVLTLPVLVLIGWGLLWAFTRSAVYANYNGGCPHCAELGWKEAFPTEKDHRLNITEWLAEDVVHEFRARRLAHRVLWQRYFDRYPEFQPKYRNAWKKYGLWPVGRGGK